MKTLASVPAPFSSPVIMMISYLTGTRLRALLAKLSTVFVHSKVRNSSLFGERGIRALQRKMYLGRERRKWEVFSLHTNKPMSASRNQMTPKGVVTVLLLVSKLLFSHNYLLDMPVSLSFHFLPIFGRVAQADSSNITHIL